MPQKKQNELCPICKRVVGVRPCDKEKAIAKSGAWICGKCTRAIRNTKNARPDGTKRVHNGYIEIKHNGSWLRQHRYVASQMIGRPIKDGEVVHHINGNKMDNRPDNLKVMPSGAHTAMHHTGTSRGQTTRERIAERARNRHTQQKLTAADVLTIRSEYATGLSSYAKLAAEFGVTRRAIATVVKRISWRHV